MALLHPILLGSSAAGDYEIQRSIRFNHNDSAYFKRTSVSSPTSVKVWTMSLWIKRDALVNGSDMEILFGNDYNTASVSTRGLQFGVNHSSGINDMQLDVFDGASGNQIARSDGKYRDPTAWMHLVVRCNTPLGTQSSRLRIYVNGEDIGLSNNLSQNQELTWNKGGREQYLGCHAVNGSPTRFYRGYIAEAHFIDGGSKGPENFAETDAVSGEYKPIEYKGTYGNNGWYCAFTDNSNTTATTLGKDYSGNGNNMTPFNFSVSSGNGNDSVTDTPTNNWCTLNPLAMIASGNVTPSNGNLDASFGTVSGGGGIASNFALRSGKWYWETKVTAVSSAAVHIGVLDEGLAPFSGSPFYDPGVTAESYSYQNNGTKYNDNTNTSYGATYTTNDIIGVKLDLDNGTIEFLKNNSSQGTAFTGLTGGFTPAYGDGSSAGTHSISVNFGQQGFTYTIPAGYKAINSQNLSASTATPGSQYINTVLYTANRTARSITGVGFQPDWVWIKSRDASQDHAKFDAVRGVHKSLKSNSNFQEQDFSNTLTSFDSDGFSLGNDMNVGNVNYAQVPHVAWNWFAGGSTVTNTNGNISSQVRASTTAGFSIVGYSGNGSNGQTVGHGLGVAPDAIILKCRTANQNWRVWHKSLATDGSKRLILDQTNSSEDAGFLNDTAPTSTVFTLGNSDEAWNESGDTYIAYVFSEVQGFSKFGKYTGNGNSDGTFVFCGFRPAWIMVKRSSATEDWAVWDSTRDSGYNPNGFLLRPNGTDSEGGNVGAHQIDIVSNGFKFRNSDSKGNGSGSTYVYFAFAELPFKHARAR